MLVTQQKVLRRFWYPVIPVGLLADGPKPFTLLGEEIVLWRDSAGRVAALADRCCHRTAKLSLGFYDETGNLACGYHGWSYDVGGQCVRIPQFTRETVPAANRVHAYKAEEKYGYVWVCLDEAPLTGIPDISEVGQPGFRKIDQFYEVWKCAGLRLMENSFDNAHINFVHIGTFGDRKDAGESNLEFTPEDWGFRMKTSFAVKNTELASKVVKMDSAKTTRFIESTWFVPFTRRLRITYPNGLVHIIFTAATPIDDRSSMIVQFCLRSDTEAEVPAADIIAFDREVTAEDKRILETTEFDVALDDGRGWERHMASDKPGLMMRKKLIDVLAANGETEVHGPRPRALWPVATSIPPGTAPTVASKG